MIIPCYNHGHFLAQAIESVARQTYPAWEIIVVDDGSTDDTRAVAARFPSVKYIYQSNQGLSAARNTGIEVSTGAYLVFLDADDWLFPDGLAANVRHLRQHPPAAFAVGSHTMVLDSGRRAVRTLVESPTPYLTLIARGNYLAMIASVLFARWVFAEFRYDTALANCEDYDLFLKITRRHPIVQHQEQVAAYRVHSAAMSANSPAMLRGALRVLRGQRPYLHSAVERAAYRAGARFWARYYYEELHKDLADRTIPVSRATAAVLLKHSSSLGARYLSRHTGLMLKERLKNSLPNFSKRWLHSLGLLARPMPDVGDVDLGDLSRLTPFSTEFGYDRGGPIDRYYIEGFLQREAASIRGRVLEIGDNEYTLRYGGDKLTRSDILHIDASNPKATLVGDLSAAPHLPDDAFDCLVLTQTLHLIYDFRAALRTCHRILKPGGTLLLTAPGLTPIDKGEWQETWYWSFTAQALRRLLAETFAGAAVEVGSFGNVHAATAYLYGMGLPEISAEKLDYYDPQFQVINTVKATKGPVRA